MFSFTNRASRLTSIFAMLLGVSLSMGSVACVAPTGSDETETTNATAAAQEQAPSKAQPQPQDDADADAGTKEPTVGDIATGQTPAAKEPGQGGGGGDPLPAVPHAGHTSPNMQ